MTGTKLIVTAAAVLVSVSALVAQSTPAAPTNLRILGNDAPPPPAPPPSPPPSPSPPPPPPPAPGASHDYFTYLSGLPNVLAAYSLRDPVALAQVRRGRDADAMVTYDPVNDPDPRKQDAAKFVIEKTSLQTQLWMPTNHVPRQSLFVTFDDWLGKEWHFEHGQVATEKAWNLCGPGNGIWTEIQHRFQMAAGHDAMSAVAIRQYNPRLHGPNTLTMGGQSINGKPPTYGNYGNNVIGPMVGEFGTKAETWTRYFLHLEPEPAVGPEVDPGTGELRRWYRMSFWVADEHRDPVQIYRQLQIAPRIASQTLSMDGTWDILRFEYNSSTSSSTIENIEERGHLIGYARNVVILRDVDYATAQSLLQRPVR